MKKDDVRIATPCGENWESMTPERGGRLCATCDKVVHDLSTMSEANAKRLMARKGNLCVRYLYDEHGNIWFEGDRPALAARLLNRAKRGAAAAAALAAPFALQACMGTAPYDGEEIVAVDAGSADDAGHVNADPSLDDGGNDAAETDDASPTDVDGGDADTSDGG